jgi:hypothetical protein
MLPAFADGEVQESGRALRIEGLLPAQLASSKAANNDIIVLSIAVLLIKTGIIKPDIVCAIYHRHPDREPSPEEVHDFRR